MIRKLALFIVGLVGLALVAIGFDNARGQTNTPSFGLLAYLNLCQDSCAGYGTLTITATTTPVNVANVSHIQFSCAAACTVSTWSNVVHGKIYTICIDNSNTTINRTASYTIGGTNYNPTVASGETCNFWHGEPGNTMRMTTPGANSL